MNFKFNVEVIPHEQQRYKTVGDYWLDDDGVVQVRVSDTGNEYFNFLVAIHEVNELMVYMMRHNYSPKAALALTDEFDMLFERNRPLSDPESEPGYSPAAPYFREHMLGCIVEHYVAAMLNIDYNEYNAVIQALYEKEISQSDSAAAEDSRVPEEVLAAGIGSATPFPGVGHWIFGGPYTQD